MRLSLNGSRKGDAMTGCADRCKVGQRRLYLRSLRVLEIGAGGKQVGEDAGLFTRYLGADASLRRALLRYANRRPMRRGGSAFRSISLVATDRDWNPANDFRMDAESLPLRSGSIDLIVSVGPRGYGFRSEHTAAAFLQEASRVLAVGGELIVIGSFVNPWFNLRLGSRGTRRAIGQIGTALGLRMANYLLPLGRHAISVVFRGKAGRIVQHRTSGEVLGPPAYLHRFIKSKQLGVTVRQPSPGELGLNRV